MREAVSKEANIHGDDAFALLEYLGAGSAGSLVLLPPGQDIKVDCDPCLTTSLHSAFETCPA